MAKIINKVEWRLTFTCAGRNGCGSELEISGPDVRFSHQMAASNFYVVCPVCGAHQGLPQNQIPDGITQKARDAYYH
jgi:hypothetical protein